MKPWVMKAASTNLKIYYQEKINRQVNFSIL